MLRADPQAWLRRLGNRTRRWWQAGSTRLRLRRRLIVASLPVALGLLALATMIATVLLTGNKVVGDFTRHDTDALHGDLDRLSKFNVLEPHKLPFAQGDLAVLEGRLDDAESSFSDALSQHDDCPTRINLELVRETQGDLAATRNDIDKAEERYNAALEPVRGAPADCFAGNDDPDEERRHIRQDAEPRLLAKIDSLRKRRESPPPPPPTPQSESGSPSPAPAPPTDASTSLTPTGIPGPAPDSTGTPQTTAPTPAPTNSGPDNVPVFGPEQNVGGKEAMNDVDPDRLPTGGGTVKKPGHELGVGGDPLESLQDALRDSNSTGSNQE